MSDEKIKIQQQQEFTRHKEDTRFVTSKLEETYQLADGTMLEVRRHEFHAGEQDALNYKKANKNAKVKSISGKKAQKQLQENKEKIAQLRAQGDLDSFILNGELVQKTAVSNTNMSTYMEENMLSLEEATERAEELKTKIENLAGVTDDMNEERMSYARQLKALYTEAGRIEEESVRAAIEREYGPLCEYILQENEFVFSDKIFKPFTDFRKAAGRLMKKDGTIFYSEKKWDEQKREEYRQDEEYYDYIAQMEKVEKEKAIETLGISKDKMKMEAFEKRFNLLKVYHLHRAKEANRKIDLVKWYQEAKDDFGDDDFLSDEPIYKNREEVQDPDTPHN